MAAGLALVVGLLVLGACGGRDAELQEYARQMQGFLDAAAYSAPHMDDLEKLTDIQPPREMRKAHWELVQATEMAVLTDEHARELEALEQQRFDREYPEEGAIIACANSIDEYIWWKTSQTFREACQLESMAIQAYGTEVVLWSGALSQACGGSDREVVGSSAIETCLR